MAPREAENNAYAKFWGDKQRALWYVMVFSGVVNSTSFQLRYETCLVPRPHYSARPKRFGSRGPNEASMKLRERCAIQIRAHCQYIIIYNI